MQKSIASLPYTDPFASLHHHSPSTPRHLLPSPPPLSTLLLLLKSQARGERTGALLDLAFKVTWVLSRCLWFPVLAVYLSSLPNWPSLGRRLLCSGCTFGLVLLQWLWTIQAARGKRPVREAKA